MNLSNKVWLDINTIVWDTLDKQVANSLSPVSKDIWEMVEEFVYNTVGVAIDPDTHLIEMELMEYEFGN